MCWCLDTAKRWSHRSRTASWGWLSPPTHTEGKTGNNCFDKYIWELRQDMRAEKMNWNSKSSPQGATVSDSIQEDEIPEPSMAGVRWGGGEWGSWGTDLQQAVETSVSIPEKIPEEAMPRGGHTSQWRKCEGRFQLQQSTCWERWMSLMYKGPWFQRQTLPRGAAQVHRRGQHSQQMEKPRNGLSQLPFEYFRQEQWNFLLKVDNLGQNNAGKHQGCVSVPG